MKTTRKKVPGAVMSKEVFREVIEASTDAVIIAGDDGGVSFWNRSAGRLFGYDHEEACRITLLDLMPEEYHERHREGFSRFIRTGEGRIIGKPVIVKGKRKDGSVFPIELGLAAYKSGGKWVVAAIIRDITDRRAFEQKLAHQSRLLARANKELALLASISSLLSQSMEFTALLNTILDTITRINLFKFERKGGVFILKDGALELVAHLGHTGDFLEKHRSIKFGECLCGLAAETGEVITSCNSCEDPRHTIVYEGMKPHGHIIIPLKAKDAVVGVLYLYLKPWAVVDGDRKAFLESIGVMLGVAVSNSLLYEETRRLALHDPLTALPNKRLLDIELERNSVLARRCGRPFSCLMLDIDHFKKFNDRYGHVAGDRLLQTVSKVMRTSLRESDFVARYGGEEFCVILPETGADKAAVVAGKLCSVIREKTEVTVSLGVAAFDPGMASAAEMVVAADKALYRAKELGRDRVELFVWR